MNDKLRKKIDADKAALLQLAGLKEDGTKIGFMEKAKTAISKWRNRNVKT